MKILYVLDVYPVYSETFIRNEIKEMKNQGHELIISSFNKGDDIKLEESQKLDYCLNDLPYSKLKAFLLLLKSGFSKLKFGFQQKSISKKSIFFNASKIAKLAKMHEVDHIHAHFGSNASAFAIQAAKLAETTSSFTIHGYDINKEKKDLHLKTKATDLVVSVSDELKEKLTKECLNDKTCKNKIKVVYFGVDPKNKIKRIEKDNGRYLFVGRLNEVKGLEQIIEVWNKDKKETPLDVIGSGSEEYELFLKNKVLDCNINIKFLGHKESKEIFNFLSKYKAIILPFVENPVTKEKDTGSIITKESMLMEIPIITSDIIPFIADKNSAYISKSSDPKSLSLAIKEFEEAKKSEIKEKTETGLKNVLTKYTTTRQVGDFTQHLNAL